MNSAFDLINTYAGEISVMENSEKIIGDEFLREKLEVSGKVEFMTGAEIKGNKGRRFYGKNHLLGQKKNSQTKKIDDLRINVVNLS